MAGFQRRFTSFPDATTIREIEGVIIVDAAPDGSVQGADSGTVALVGEYEDGPFMTDPAQPVDAFRKPGGLVLVGRDQWASLVGSFGFTHNGQKNQFPCCRRSNGELWNGNAYVQAKGLAFRRFYAARVDTSVGSLVFSPLAFLETGTAGPWVVANSQTLVCSVNGAGDATATFTAAAAVVTGTGASFATLTAGEWVEISIDSKPTIRVTFNQGDDTIAEVVDRINVAFGSPIASNATSQLRLSSATLGTSSRVQIVAGSTGTLTKLGHAVGTTSGTGNVADANAVTFSELKTVVEAAVSGSVVRQTATGKARLCSATGTSGTIRVQASSTATGFGFATASTRTASSGSAASSIPAGTLCNAAGASATRVVTMQSLSIPASTTSAVTVKCRPAQDDGTYAGATASTVTTIESVISPTAEWAVTNPSALAAALTEAQKDAAYEAALARTKAMSGPTRTINYIVSARQSNRVRAAVLENAKQSSSRGCQGRKARLAPPIGTSLATMTGSTEPGVGAYRNERACYSPGWRKYISEIAALGASLGGVGFTDDGIVETHGDIVLASLDSLLNPEENSAQPNDLIPRDTYLGVESAIASWDIDDYIAAKRAGICAPLMHETEGPQYQSGVTTVDPNTFPSQVPIQRVKLADFATDSVAEFESPQVKKLRTESRTSYLLEKVQEFLQDLQTAERIDAFTVEEGPRVRRAHVLNWRIEPLDSMDAIVNNTSIGEGALSTTRQGA